MHFSLSDAKFLLVAAVGSVLIARFYLSRASRFFIFPPMALEIAFGFLLARVHVASAVVSSPTYFLGEAGVVAVIAAGGTHVLAKGTAPVVARAIRIAILGVVFSALMAALVLLALSYSLLEAVVIALALAPSSAGVASRVLASADRSRSRQAKTFFVTAVFDDMLGLVGLAVVEVVILHGGSNSVIGLATEALAALLGFGANRLIAKRSDGGYRERVQIVAWVGVCLAAFASQALSASPIVVAFVLAVSMTSLLGNGKVTRNVERIGFGLLPLFFVSLGAIAGGFSAPISKILAASGALILVAAAAKLLAARIGFGSAKGFAVGVMLAPRAEITFVIALAGATAGVVTGADLFMIALVCVVLGVGASMALAKIAPNLES